MSARSLLQCLPKRSAWLLLLSLAGPVAAMEASEEHCRQMPAMPGCERFRPAADQAKSAAPVLPGAGLAAVPAAAARPIVDLKDGDHYTLRAQVVTKTVNGVPLRLYAYNGSVPGPLLRVRQGSNVTIDFINDIDQDTTVHWHGLRVENSQDGVPGVTQPPVPPGGRHRYTLRFPDEGIYWYHPHVREDFQQDAGLYGNIHVLPAADGYGPVEHEEALILDDLLIEDGRQAPYRRDTATHALMGRYGNVLLVNGVEQYRLAVQAGQRVRFYLTNAANARPFNIVLPGVRLKRVGGDSGRYEREEYVDGVVLAPSERTVVEARFDTPGSFPLINATPDKSWELGRIDVGRAIAAPAAMELRRHTDVEATVKDFKPYLDAPVDYTLRIGLDMPGMAGGHQHSHSKPAPIEWEDTMGDVNAYHLGVDTHWYLQDVASGKKNMDIDYRFEQGKPVKIRIVNPLEGHHPMQHPVHFHGQRFLVLAVDGKPVDNQVWKDSVLVPAGSQVDILLDPSNPGQWMAHCHIAEHLSSGMMLGFTVSAAKK